MTGKTYENPWRHFTVIAISFSVAMTSFGIYLVVSFGFTNANLGVMKWVAVGIGCLGFAAGVGMLSNGYRSICWIEIKGPLVTVRTYFWGLTETRAEKITEVVEVSRLFAGPRLRLSVFEGVKHLYLAPEIKHFGQLVEDLLEMSPNLHAFHVRKLLSAVHDPGETTWQKEPNMEIINAAKARAEENAKKLKEKEDGKET